MAVDNYTGGIYGVQPRRHPYYTYILRYGDAAVAGLSDERRTAHNGRWVQPLRYCEAGNTNLRIDISTGVTSFRAS